MKVVAFQSDEKALVSMTISELLKLSGFSYGDDFNKAFGTSVYCSSEAHNKDSKRELMAVEDIPVSTIYSEAKETLGAYEELRTKFESIRNQLTTLMRKMTQATKKENPEEG